jgi:hypothetical protein
MRSRSIFTGRGAGGNPRMTRFTEGPPASTLLDEVSRVPADTALRMLASDPRGLSETEVDTARTKWLTSGQSGESGLAQGCSRRYIFSACSSTDSGVR